MKNMLIATATLALAATGCQTTGEGALTGAAVGAAAGAIAGEVFAGRPGRGAAYGAAIGAALGAYEGCSRAGTCFGRARDHGQRRKEHRVSIARDHLGADRLGRKAELFG
ncbi:MAG: hypothetical protein AAFQ96_08530, partial [Pseudomonadota bacterium]